MKLIPRTEPLKKIRENHFVPGVIYSKKITSTPIQVEYKDLLNYYRKYGKSMTFKAKLDGKTHQVYIKAVQLNPLNQREFLHFDLMKVTASDTITADIPIHLFGKEKVEALGLVVQLIAQTVETEYNVGKGITSFEINVEDLEQGDALYIRDIELGEGLKILDPEDKMIVNVTVPTYEDEPTDDEEDIEDEEDVEVEAIKQKGDDSSEEDKEE